MRWWWWWWVAACGGLNVSRVPRWFHNEKLLSNFEKRGWKTEIRECDRYIFSRRLNRTCMPGPRTAYDVLPLLVTGTAGVGTRAVAHLMSLMGLRTGHETYDAHATVSWTHAVNDFAFGVPYPFSGERTKWWQLRPIMNRVDIENAFKPKFLRVVHLVRCPLRAIASLLRPHAPVARFVEKVTASPPITTPCAAAYDCETTLEERVGWALSTYVAWNEHAERYADERMRVEDLAANASLGARLCTFAAAKMPKFATTCEDRAREAARANNNATHHHRRDATTLLGLAHLEAATFGPGIDGPATVDEFLEMGARYGYDDACIRGGGGGFGDARPVFWSSRERRLASAPPVAEELPAASQSKRGIESCLQEEEECSPIERTCPKAPAPRNCLRAAVPFRTPYRRLKCCFRCCVSYWLESTRLADNIRFQNSHIQDKPETLGYFAHNPDTGDLGIDPLLNMLVHPHLVGAVADVRLHAMTGCHLSPSLRPRSLNATIASLYHYQPDDKMLPPRGVTLPNSKRVFEKDAQKFPCVRALRESRKVVVDVFDPRKWLPGRHLGDRLALFLANNVDNGPVSEEHAGRVVERVIGVRGVSLWQALLEHPDLSRSLPRRDRLLLCCCMNVDGMHKGRMEHTKILALHPEFDCPLGQDYQFHHIGRPKNDPGLHEIEHEVILMLNERYGNKKGMTGSYDAHMPVLMATSKFVFSPNGVGEQCYREYEALVAGAIPVLDDTAYAYRRNLLAKLPTILVRNWSDVTPDFLKAKWAEMERRDYDVSILYTPYWYDTILKAIGVV